MGEYGTSASGRARTATEIFTPDWLVRGMCDMRDYKTWYEQVMEGLLELDKAMSKSYGLDDDVFRRFMNCVNCDHYEVCVVVHDRKRRQAGDYSPCGKWKLVEK